MEAKQDSAFIDLAAAVWKRKWMVLAITLAAVIFAVAYGMAGGAKSARIVPHSATWVKVIARVAPPDTGFPGDSAVPGGVSKDESTWREPLSSNQTRVRIAKTIADGSGLIDALDASFDLRKHYGIADRNPVAYREAFRSHFKTDIDASIDIVILAFEDEDPEFASRVVDAMVAYIDGRISALVAETLRSRIERIDALVTASGGERSAFQTRRALAEKALASPTRTTSVLERETATLLPVIRPARRSLVAIAGVFSAIFLAFFLAVALESLDRARHDPVTVARFKALSARRKKQ